MCRLLSRCPHLYRYRRRRSRSHCLARYRSIVATRICMDLRVRYVS